MRKPQVRAMTLVLLMTTPVVAQNPKPPMPLPAEIQSVDQLPILDAVTLWIDGQDLIVYIDMTSNPDDQNKLTTLEINWNGPGPGFVEENCDFDGIFNGIIDVCTHQRIAKVSTRGFGPVFSLGNLIPEGYRASWTPADSWIVDGSYLTGCLDKVDPDSPYFGPTPEPSSLTLLCLGLLLLLRRRPSQERTDKWLACEYE